MLFVIIPFVLLLVSATVSACVSASARNLNRMPRRNDADD